MADKRDNYEGDKRRPLGESRMNQVSKLISIGTTRWGRGGPGSQRYTGSGSVPSCTGTGVTNQVPVYDLVSDRLASVTLLKSRKYPR